MGIGPSVEFKRRKRKVVLYRISGIIALLIAISGGYALLTRTRHTISGAPGGIGQSVVRAIKGLTFAEYPRRNGSNDRILDTSK